MARAPKHKSQTRSLKTHVDPANQSKAKFALVRPVPSSYDRCVRTSTETIDVELARQQHDQYCQTLKRLGLELVHVKPDHTLPDSCFVEDTAFVFDEKAIICNMSVPTRAPEAAAVAQVLTKLKQVHHIKPPATIDGGDVLRVEDKVFVGLSARTDTKAVNQLKQILKNTSLHVIPVKVRNVLHLKSACTSLGDHLVIIAENCFDTNVLSGLKEITVPKGEEYAADCLAVNGTVLMSKGYPRTKKLIEDEGLPVQELGMSEFKKGDGALTCLSIVW